MSIHDKHRQWIEARGLDPVLAEKLGLRTEKRDGKAWLVVPYVEAGVAVNHKWRLTSEKDHRMDPGAPLSLWNADCLKDPAVRSGQAPVVITEGEWDAMAAMQAGFPFAVSVPNGAPSTKTKDLDGAKRYEWVDRHADDLAQVKEFIIAVDDDQAGRYLRADLVALLGADRCRFVEYPFPSKDLNEIINDHDLARATQALTMAKHFPVQGIYQVDDFPEKGEVRAYSVGVQPIAEMLAIVPGTLTVVTGYANMGKSTLMNSVIGNALLHHFPVCIASFETDVKPILVEGLQLAMMGCAKAEMRHERNRDMLDDVTDRIRKHLTIISQSVDEDMEMDLDKFLELARVAVVRYGAKMIVLDPWNEIEHKSRRGESETEYIGRAIRAIKRFAKQYDVAFWIIAHPTKPSQNHGANYIPGLYDISGSANWANKADYGMTYHRPKFDENKAFIIINKVRMGLPGKRGKVKVTYDFRISAFVQLEDDGYERD